MRPGEVQQARRTRKPSSSASAYQSSSTSPGWRSRPPPHAPRVLGPRRQFDLGLTIGERRGAALRSAGCSGGVPGRCTWSGRAGRGRDPRAGREGSGARNQAPRRSLGRSRRSAPRLSAASRDSSHTLAASASPYSRSANSPNNGGISVLARDTETAAQKIGVRIDNDPSMLEMMKL
jgi:hypothetical protein